MNRRKYILIKDLLRKYSSVHWVADINNPACEKYKEICKKLGGNYFKDKSTSNVIYFEIEGNVFYEYSSLSSSKQLKDFREKSIKELDKELLEGKSYK